jgi:hypothetical protein
MSMNEAIIAVVCVTCFVAAANSWWLRNRRPDQPSDRQLMLDVLGLSTGQWILCGMVTAALFGTVYQFSGLAEFQTGRFVALGDNAMEVILSPILRPDAFWGELFQWKKLAFVLSLVLPCYVVSLALGWRWLVPVCVPLGLLLVWDHRPASCLAFQYPSSFLPLLWLATLTGASKIHSAGSAAAALATGLVLSLFVGQLPYSSPSLLDITTRSYGAEAIHSRGPDTELGRWLAEQIEFVRADGREVLASGRIAAHLLGNRDVETVGQYLYRKPQLAEVEARQGNPIRHYRWILLDREEAMQQTPQESLAVEREALENGFSVVEERDAIIVLRQL